jgi:hypothetical protein
VDIWAPLEEAAPELSSRLEEVSRRPFEELARLPASSDVGISSGGVEFTLHRETLPDGRLQIVLQAYRPGRHFLFLRFGHMLARGFWVSEGGPVRPMPKDALHDYM